MYSKRILLFVFNILILCKYTWSERLNKQIYSSISGSAACFRRLNGTHQAGCASPDSGAVGVVHMINNVDDAQWMVFNGTAGPYIGIINTALFDDVVELLMKNPDNVAGIFIYDNATIDVTQFSQESQCPNEYASWHGNRSSTSQYVSHGWNKKGTGLIRRDIPFPIFYLPQSRIEEVDKIQKCYERYNLNKDNQKGTALCSVELNAFMYAAVNSAICIRRSASSGFLSFTKVCDPLGDYNVYYSTFPMNKDAKKKTLLVTGRLDTASLFDGVAPGAASTVVSLVTLLTAAATLSDMVKANGVNIYEKNILWTLFNGEAFDYIGSQRVAYDLSRGAWPARAPLSPRDVTLHVELGQVGGALRAASGAGAWPLYALAPNISSDMSPQVTDFLNQMKVNLNVNNLDLITKVTDDLPPSSLHSFRRILTNYTESGVLGQIVIVDHEETFSNMYYHSVLDDSDKISFNYHNISVGADGIFMPTDELVSNGTFELNDTQVKIAKLANSLASTLYQQAVGQSYVGNISASAHMVDELLYCFLKNQTCRALSAADYASSGGAGADEQKAAPLYVGVSTWNNSAAVFAGHLLALFTGEQLKLNRTQCYDVVKQKPDFSYYYLQGWNNSGVCIQTTMNFSQALSPAFTIPDYEMSSGEYSSWTESVWRGMSARVFVSAGGGGARAAAGAGAAVTLLAALLTRLVRARADKLFAPTPTHRLNTAATGILRTVNC